jgi:hypothetical protein
MITIDEVSRYARSLPEATETAHWEKPSFRVRDKIFAVIQPDGRTVTVKTAGEDRAFYTALAPEVYRVTETFSKLNYMHVDLELVDPREMKELLWKAWGCVAPKKLVKATKQIFER